MVRSFPQVATTVAFRLLILLCIASGCRETPDSPEQADDESIQLAVVTFCGACHAVPDPQSFPRDAWHKEVEQGFKFYYQSGRTDLVAPPMNAVTQWYRARAPETLTLAKSHSTESPVAFAADTVSIPISNRPSAVSHIRSSTRDASTQLLVADMSLNACFQVRREKTGWTSEKIVDCSHPAHIEATDLNGDGATDYLVAILGSYAPEDHNKGQVVWYRPELGEQGNTIILKDVGRVADVQPADFDGDGDLDLIVAEFGWRRTGQIRLLEQTGMQEGVPRFRSSIIDKRHGAIHVPVADIDGDGDLDFVALVAQEFEEVAAFLNRGDGQFERQVIFQAGNPSYGSSGIQVVDLDGDRDLDVLLTNGDSLDSNYLKSYHGIHWLENRGDYPFEYHLLTQLPGVCRAVTGDLDGDGDLDVAACAWVPHDTRSKASTDDGKFETLLWLQNHKNESFARHVLAAESQAGYMTLDTGDADADGDLDIVAGYFQSKGQTSRWVDIYLNQGRRK